MHILKGCFLSTSVWLSVNKGLSSPPAPVPPPSAPARGIAGPEARPDPRLDPRYRGEPLTTENPLLEIDDPDLDAPTRRTSPVGGSLILVELQRRNVCEE